MLVNEISKILFSKINGQTKFEWPLNSRCTIGDSSSTTYSAINSNLNGPVEINVSILRASGNCSYISLDPYHCKSIRILNPEGLGGIKEKTYFHVKADGSFNLIGILNTLNALAEHSFKINYGDIHMSNLKNIIQKRKNNEAKRSLYFNKFKQEMNTKIKIVDEIPNQSISLDIKGFCVNVSFTDEGPVVSHITTEMDVKTAITNMGGKLETAS